MNWNQDFIISLYSKTYPCWTKSISRCCYNLIKANDTRYFWYLFPYQIVERWRMRLGSSSMQHQRYTTVWYSNSQYQGTTWWANPKSRPEIRCMLHWQVTFWSRSHRMSRRVIIYSKVVQAVILNPYRLHKTWSMCVADIGMCSKNETIMCIWSSMIWAMICKQAYCFILRLLSEICDQWRVHMD